MFARPQPRNGEAEGDHRAGEAKEKGRGVDRHPVVLQAGVQAVALKQRNVIRLLKDGCIDGLPQQQHRAGTQFYHPVSHAEVDAKDHGHDHHLHGAERGHHGAFPPPRRDHEYISEDDVPEHPEQERALLALPKGTENVPLLEVRAHVGAHVLVLVVLVQHRVKDATDHGKHRRPVEEETQLPEALPLAAAQLFGLEPGGQKVAHHAENGREEREQQREMADVAGAEVFVDVGDFLH